MSLNYLEATGHLEEGRKGKAAEVAQLNLTDSNLSRFYRMKNLLLVVTAEKDWCERERCRRKAEGIWLAADRLTGEDTKPPNELFRPFARNSMK